MSVNTAHTSNGVLLHSGEFILLYSGNIKMQCNGDHRLLFHGCKCGRIYLTSHRLIFRNKKAKDDMQSFSAPFTLISDLKIEQQVLGPNYVQGVVRPQPNGNLYENTTFKLYFKSGGAIEFGRALNRAVTITNWLMKHHDIRKQTPPYKPPSVWHEVPPPAYQAPKAHAEWLPSHTAFADPEPNTVYVSDCPAPYVGVGVEPPENLKESLLDDEENLDAQADGCACPHVKPKTTESENSVEKGSI